jgi:hypothetical protein
VLHGPGTATWVCQHLHFGVGCGVHHADEPDDPWPDAWCDSCARVLEHESEWTDAMREHAAMRMLCHRCYEFVRERNREVPLPIRPGELDVDERRFDSLIQHAIVYTERCQKRAEHEFHMLGYARWFWTAETRELSFHDEPKTHELCADADVIGSFSLDTGTWMWCWGNPNYDADAKRRIDPVRTFGEVRGIEKLSDPHFIATEEVCWELAAVTNYLLKGQGVYRAPMDHLYVFMLLDKLRFRAV